MRQRSAAEELSMAAESQALLTIIRLSPNNSLVAICDESLFEGFTETGYVSDESLGKNMHRNVDADGFLQKTIYDHGYSLVKKLGNIHR